MFYFTCNESRIYCMKVSLFEISYKKIEPFHDILIFWDAPVCNVYFYGIDNCDYWWKKVKNIDC